VTKTKCRAGTPISCGTSNVEIDCTNISSAAERMAGRAMRNVMARNVRSGDEPDASAASPSDESTDVNAAVPIR
jgi:hypothetical protein